MDANLWSRRTLLRVGGAAAAGLLVPSWLAAASRVRRPGASLVVCCLVGGNDGLNTVVPFRSSEYYRQRPSLAIPASEAIPLDDSVGLHPSLTGLASLYRQGNAAILQGVGYPGHHRSHFRSMQVWQSASLESSPQSGWLGRHLAGPGASKAVCLDQEVPLTLAPDRPSPSLCTQLSCGASRAPFSDDPFGRAFCTAAETIKGSPSTQVVHLSVGGFDTHTRQSEPHGLLLRGLGDALEAFQRAVEGSGHADHTLVLVFSEFGRSFRENASQGTDHGQGGPVLVVGSKVRGAVYGDAPDLANLSTGASKSTLDFRRIYATLLDQWLGGNSGSVLGGKFEHLPLLRA